MPKTSHPVGGTPRTFEDGFSYTDPSDLSASGSYSIYPYNIQPAYIQEMDLTGGYPIMHTTSLQLGYISENGLHVEDDGNFSQYIIPLSEPSAPY